MLELYIAPPYHNQSLLVCCYGRFKRTLKKKKNNVYKKRMNMYTILKIEKIKRLSRVNENLSFFYLVF